jgi:sulfatase modifying factor 1
MRKIGLLACGVIAATGVVLSAQSTHAANPPSVVESAGHASSKDAKRTPSLLPAGNVAAALSLGGIKVVGAAELPHRAGAPAPGSCPSDMVEVEGEYCPYVVQPCKRWMDPKTHMRCAEFAPSLPCHMKTTHKKFCVDRYEWPNEVGKKPEYMASWREAKGACEIVGKRLCTDSEWTMACEGEEHLPYPYGLKRDSEACNIDRAYGFPDPRKVYDADTQEAELARLDGREPSGNRPACVSPYGAHDMAGNVDEWVVNETGDPYKSGLKGGYWGPVKTRCRPMTVAHEETFRYYQIGFRCCQ